MRLPALTPRALVLVTALAAAFVIAPATAAQAVCNFTVSSLTWSPAPVNNAADTTVTVTMKATAGFSYISINMPLPDAHIRLTPVSGSSGTYRGTLKVLSGTAAGAYGLTDITSANSQCFLATFSGGYSGPSLDALGLDKLVVTGQPDTQVPAVAAFSGGSGQYNAKVGATIPVTVRATDDVSGVASVTVSASGAFDETLPTPFSAYRRTSVALTRTAGTLLDGTWTGSLPVVAGTQQEFTYELIVTDRSGRSYTGPPTAPSATTFRTVTTAAPATPTGVKAVSAYRSGSIGPVESPGGWYGAVSWKPPVAGTSGVTHYRLTTSGSCAGANYFFTSWTTAEVHPSGRGLCKVTVTAHNAFGASAGVSASAII